jgi:hypothetical protein
MIGSPTAYPLLDCRSPLFNSPDHRMTQAMRGAGLASPPPFRAPRRLMNRIHFPRPHPWQNSALPSCDPERSPSGTSSQSQKKLPSIISSLHVASKRTSTSSSLYSVATTSSNPQHVGTFSIARALRSGHRLSMSPPRPAPCTALPPIPTGSDTESPVIAPLATVKTVRRNSLARRALRLSLGQLATAPVESAGAVAHMSNSYFQASPLQRRDHEITLLGSDPTRGAQAIAPRCPRYSVVQ